MKFNPSPRLARMLGELLADTLIDQFPTLPWDVVTFIPTSYRSGLSRQFNQCELMAYTISSIAKKRLGNPLPTVELIYRKFKRAPHSTLPHQRRLSRLQSLFTPSLKARGKKILLIEDVITTGATISAACYALRKAEVGTISVASLARSPTWHSYRATVHDKTSCY